MKTTPIHSSYNFRSPSQQELKNNYKETSQVLKTEDGFEPKNQDDKDDNQAQNEITNSYTKDGAGVGFAVGCSISIIGLPILAINALEMNKKITAKTSKILHGIVVPLCLPGAIVGVIGSGIGAGIGYVIGKVKAIKKKEQGLA